MFEAFILVCAASVSMEVDSTNCITIKDTWGPYATQEDCSARTLQMVNDIGYGQGHQYVFNMLNYPPMIYTEKHCIRTKDDYI
jgi:hypothetical protein